MRIRFRAVILRLVLLLLPLAGGCAPTPPPMTPVEGVVLLDGEPLPSALVEFAPDLEQFGAEMNSSGITDEKGQFQLTCLLKSEPGAVIGKHRVVVTDAPPPAGARGPSQTAQQKMREYQKSLKNRPIPKVYSAIGSTPLTVEVTADQKVYTLKLTRRTSGASR